MLARPAEGTTLQRTWRPHQRRSLRKRRAARKAKALRRTQRHPLYGEIPLVAGTVQHPNGSLRQVWRVDPGYSPPLPPGAVRGDVRSQSFCSACHLPKYFYVDEDRTCVQCGESFVFRAAEQKHWFEALKFHFDAVPIRCVGCRRQRRSLKALAHQLATARQRLRLDPKDPSSHLALARAVVEYHQRTKEGNLNDAVSAARRARELWPEASEPLFWEGMAQVAAGRGQKARLALTEFLAHSGQRAATLDRKAREALGQG